MTAVLEPVAGEASSGTQPAPELTSGPASEARRRGASSDRIRRTIGLGVALAVVAIAHLANVTGWPVFGDDEGTYTAQAWAVLQGELAHYTYWYDHPPAGWIRLVLVILALVGLRPNGYLPIMFVIAALPFAAVATVAVALRLLGAVTAPVPAHRRPVAIAVAAVSIAMTVAAVWVLRYAVVLRSDPNADFRAAVDYLDAHAPPSSRVLADDAYWTALVERGWSGDGWRGAIWYYKLDLDPIAQARELAGGWHDVDYLIANDQIRNGVDGTEHPQLRAAYEHSVVLASCGSGERLIEVRRVLG